jgi:hypothetical protein
MPSKMPEYDATAGFPPSHVAAFQRVAHQYRCAIASRELNPLCTDLILEDYAAKPFEIKAKTCDWGPAAGFVCEEPRLTKGRRADEKGQKDQAHDIEHAFELKAQCVPLFLSEARFSRLTERKLFEVTQAGDQRVELQAAPDIANATSMKFVLIKYAGPLPGARGPVWGVFFGPGQDVKQQGHTGKHRLNLSLPEPPPGLIPVMGMVNPRDVDGKLGIRSAVAGDYDLFGIYKTFTTSYGSTSDTFDFTSPLTNRPVLPKSVGKDSLVRQRAEQAGLVYKDIKEKVKAAGEKEDPRLGNISLGTLKIKNLINQEIKAAGYKGGNMVQHSDWTHNPFADLDWPVIAFVPIVHRPSHWNETKVVLMHNVGEFAELVHKLGRYFKVELNPQWNVANVIADLQSSEALGRVRFREQLTERLW